jgi:hypothetical protein
MALVAKAIRPHFSWGLMTGSEPPWLTSGYFKSLLFAPQLLDYHPISTEFIAQLHHYLLYLELWWNTELSPTWWHLQENCVHKQVANIYWWIIALQVKYTTSHCLCLSWFLLSHPCPNMGCHVLVASLFYCSNKLAPLTTFGVPSKWIFRGLACLACLIFSNFNLFRMLISYIFSNIYMI